MTLIRKATLNDADDLFTLVTQCATSFVPQREAFEISLKQLLNDEAACLLVAEVEGECVGYCLGFDHYTFYANGRVAWVEEIMVKTEFRRQKIGYALMEAFEVWARSRGSTLIALATRRAASFYMALGYQESAAYFRKTLTD
jgi:GNAT superfamily N-acetyltransferase